VLWSAPDTRRKLLDGLEEKGFGRDQLAEMQRIIEAENSDIFDVLAYVAYAQEPMTREERAVRAKAVIDPKFNSRQQAFPLTLSEIDPDFAHQPDPPERVE
jgi:type I restriction enzyme R subunit